MEQTIAHLDTTVDEDGLSAFLSARARLFGIAYRVLRSGVEAEDIVQDVWIRWQTTERSAVRDAAAFLATMTTRLAINVVQSARSRRETSVEPSIGEAVDTSADPERGVERREALQGALRVLLMRLSPAERAAYVLREAFAYPYREIATLLCLEEANARQLVSRAKQHLVAGRQTPVGAAEQRRLLAAFIAAIQKGALGELETLLASAVACRAKKDHREGPTAAGARGGRRGASRSPSLDTATAA